MIKWHGNEMIININKEMAKRLPLAGAVVVGKTKRLLGVQGRPSHLYSGGKITHSKPGEPPRWQTKLLRQSITQDSQSPTEERIGTNVKYAIYLELGVPKGSGEILAQRPFLRPALAQSKKKIIKILTKQMK
jgi:phage gpG-like protein